MGDPRLKSRPSFQAFCYNANSDSFVFRLAKLKQYFGFASNILFAYFCLAN